MTARVIGWDAISVKFVQFEGAGDAPESGIYGTSDGGVAVAYGGAPIAKWGGTGGSSVPTQNGITAHSGGGQGSAVPLTGKINRVTTVAADHDSVLLPAAAAGAEIVVINAGAHILDVYPNGATDIINALAVETPFSPAATKVVIFFCGVAGIWNTLLTA
jgi:hypothetical protein